MSRKFFGLIIDLKFNKVVKIERVTSSLFEINYLVFRL